jgi:hypothetical protein
MIRHPGTAAQNILQPKTWHQYSESNHDDLHHPGNL